MSLQRYAQEAWRHADELAAMIEPDGLQALREQLGRLTASQASELLQELWRDALPVLQAPPARRSEVVRRLAPSAPQNLLWVATVLAVCAARILEEIDARGLAPGGSYRQTTAQAAAASMALQDRALLWPFSAPSPWAEEP